jgi:Rrf2 family iron-sulfur cluster assembly transcriptional regulator
MTVLLMESLSCPTLLIYNPCMKITTKGRYALRAVIHMAVNGKDNPISVKNITDIEDISPIFLEQIFTKLKKGGIIHSIRGAKGGFYLAKDPETITVKDIFMAVDESLTITPCAEGIAEGECNKTPGCICGRFWQDTALELYRYFEKISISELIRRYGTEGV